MDPFLYEPSRTLVVPLIGSPLAVVLMFGFVARSAAVVGIVGVLSFAMPVAAQADGLTDILALSTVVAVGGGVGVEAGAATGGAGMACAAALPVCAGVAVAVVGVALYATQDTWLPWFRNGVSFVQELGTQWSQGPSKFRMQLISATSSGTLIEVQRVDEWGGSIYISAEWAATAYCQDGVTENAGARANIPDASGGEYGYYVNVEYRPTSLPVQTTQAFCGTHGGMVGWKGQAAPSPSAFLTWGTQAPPAAAEVISAEVECVNPDGSTYAVTAAVPLPNDLVKMPTCNGAPLAQPGAHGKCVTLSGGVPGQLVEQSSNCVAAAASSALYPDCAPGGVACTYVVRIDGVPCVIGGVCAGWASIYASDPARVRCMYGHYSVPVADCAFLERVYETGHAPATVANTDGRPATWTQPGPAGQPNSQPSSPTDPAIATEPAPLPVPVAVPGVLSPSESDCWPQGWAMVFEPASWVYRPITCALRWAFVPTPAALEQLAGNATADLTKSGIGPIAAAVGVNVTKVGGGSGCDGPAVTFEAVGVVEPLHPFSACTAPMSTLASISYALTTVVCVLGGGWAAMRAIAAGFGFNMGSLGRGGDSA